MVECRPRFRPAVGTSQARPHGLLNLATVQPRTPPSCAARVAHMALETSPQAPAPVRQIANAITGWVDRLGAVWVEGQVAQVSRRAGRRHGLHHPPRLGGRHLHPGDLPARLFDSLEPPLVEGAQLWSCTPSPRTTPTAARCPSRPARSASSASASCSPGSSAAASCWRPRGCSPPSCKRRLPFLPAAGRPGHGARLRRRARRGRERPPPLARGGLRDGVRRHAGHPRRGRGDRRDRRASTATSAST